MLARPRRKVGRALAADDDRRRRRRRGRSAPPARRRAGAGGQLRRPRQRRRFTVVLVDLGQRAVALAGVVAGIGRPRVGERLEQIGGSDARAPGRQGPRAAAARAASSSSRLEHVISGSPGTPSRRACPCRCRPPAARDGGSSGSRISTFGHVALAPEAADASRRLSASVTRKSSMRTSRPSTFSPDGSVTVAVHRARTGAVGAAPRRGPRPPRAGAAAGDPQRSAAPSARAARVAMPCRSPVGEWQLAHFAAEVGGAGVRHRRRGCSSDDRLARRRPALVAALRLQAVEVRGDRLHVLGASSGSAPSASPGVRSGRPGESARRPGRSAPAAIAAGSARPAARRARRRRGRRCRPRR